MVSRGELEALVSHDQLRHEMAARRAVAIAVPVVVVAAPRDGREARSSSDCTSSSSSSIVSKSGTAR